MGELLCKQTSMLCHFIGYAFACLMIPLFCFILHQTHVVFFPPRCQASGSELVYNGSTLQIYWVTLGVFVLSSFSRRDGRGNALNE
jgi:hypothetical protein